MLFLRSLFRFKTDNSILEDDFDEEIESLVYEDGFELEDDLDTDFEQKSPIVEESETLMTEEKAKEIDNLTRSNIQREEFESELNYLKKKHKREDYEKKLIE
jgi:chitinase